MSNWKESTYTDSDVEEKSENRLEEPAKYHVFLLNDDYTPMDFVIEVLCRYFNMDTEQATDIILQFIIKIKVYAEHFLLMLQSLKLIRYHVFQKKMNTR
jgi:ATP-dependent Clp protease adaptor protein ClpS